MSSEEIKQEFDNKNEKINENEIELRAREDFKIIKEHIEKGEPFAVNLSRLDEIPNDIMVDYNFNKNEYKYNHDDFKIIREPTHMVIKFGEGKNYSIRKENFKVTYYTIDKKLLLKIYISSFYLMDRYFKSTSIDIIVDVVDISGYDENTIKGYIDKNTLIFILNK